MSSIDYWEVMQYSHPVTASNDIIVAHGEVFAFFKARAAPAVDDVQRHHLVLPVHLVAVVVQQVCTVPCTMSDSQMPNARPISVSPRQATLVLYRCLACKHLFDRQLRTGCLQRCGSFRGCHWLQHACRRPCSLSWRPVTHHLWGQLCKWASTKGQHAATDSLQCRASQHAKASSEFLHVSCNTKLGLYIARITQVTSRL